MFTLLVALTPATKASAADDLSFNLFKNYFGPLDFFTSGASFTETGGLLNGASCLLDEASLTIPPFAENERPEVVAAYLYWAGSLFSDDDDYIHEDDLFNTIDLPCNDLVNGVNNCRADNEDMRPIILAAAKKNADHEVELSLPGSSNWHKITAKDEDISTYAYYKSDGEERGNVAFFLARADVTELLKKELASFSGTYSLRGLTADICNGREALCSGGETCSSMSKVHTNATASFSLFLVLKENDWRLRRVSLYEGMVGISSKKANISIKDLGVDDPPSGKLAYYIMEGDTSLESVTDEYIAVKGGGGKILLTDALNPKGNPYNGTINSASISNVAGVDIDEFNITDSLSSGVQDLNITLSTGSDLVVLGTVAVGIGVFSPVLEYDSTLELLDGASEIPALAPATYVAKLSNTGNLDGLASFSLVLPETVKSYEIISLPEGATDNSKPGGGKGYGLIDVKNISVPVGKVAQITFKITPNCAAMEKPFSLMSTVSYEGGDFNLESSKVTVAHDAAFICHNDKPEEEKPAEPPFWQKYSLRMEGGGGCNSGGTVAFLPFLMMLLFTYWRKVRT